MIDILDPRGKFKVEHVRDGHVLDVIEFPNGITDAAKNTLWDSMFNSATQTNLWYAGLISNGSFSGVATSDISSSHVGWVEYSNYTGARKAWGQGAAASKQITNASAMVFTFTVATGSVAGIFVISDSTKGGTIGLLWATALFPAALAVQVGDVLNVTYTLSC